MFGRSLTCLTVILRFLLAGLAGLLGGLEAVLAPVHDANHDGAGVGGDLDEIETGVRRDSAGFFEWERCRPARRRRR